MVSLLVQRSVVKLTSHQSTKELLVDGVEKQSGGLDDKARDGDRDEHRAHVFPLKQKKK